MKINKLKPPHVNILLSPPVQCVSFRRFHGYGIKSKVFNSATLHGLAAASDIKSHLRGSHGQLVSHAVFLVGSSLLLAV